MSSNKEMTYRSSSNFQELLDDGTTCNELEEIEVANETVKKNTQEGPSTVCQLRNQAE